MDTPHGSDKFKNKTVRAKPSQARGKERVRLILAAALQLFREHGMEQVTTNDIAERAKIPIGSLYRYYPNKESIIEAIIDLYVEDLSFMFKEFAHNPMLRFLSWEEVIGMLLGGWANYSRLNGSFAFLFGVWANPSLYEQTYKTQVKFIRAFTTVLKKRYPETTAQQSLLCFNMSVIAVKMAINKEDQAIGGADLFHESVRAIASYMDSVSESQDQAAGDILT